MRKKTKGILKPLPASPRPLSNGFQLSEITREKSDDFVGFAVVCGSNDNRVCLKERHLATTQNSKSEYRAKRPDGTHSKQISKDEKSSNVKLPAHRAGLPEEEVLFILCPFLPAGRQGPRLSRFGGTGHVPAKIQMTNGCQNDSMSRFFFFAQFSHLRLEFYLNLELWHLTF